MFKINLDEIIEAVERDDNTGFCLACGAERMYTEPDAREYPCEECDENQVYGAEEILFDHVG